MQKLSQALDNNFSEKYHLYGDMLFKISMTHLCNKEDAEEAMQEAFFKLLYKSPEFNDNEHEKAWLIRTIVNICKDMRKNVWYKKTVKIEEVEEYYDNSRDLDVIMDVFSLPMKFKTIIYLHYFEGYSIKEISGVLKLTESAVKMRLMRGRQLLKMKLEEEYR